MGATKTENFTTENLKIALLSRAFAHPARVKIVELLRENTSCGKKDLVRVLCLSQKTIYDHLLKLRDAELIHLKYNNSGWNIILNEDPLEALKVFISSKEK